MRLPNKKHRVFLFLFLFLYVAKFFLFGMLLGQSYTSANRQKIGEKNLSPLLEINIGSILTQRGTNESCKLS